MNQKLKYLISETGFTQWVILIILMLGIGVGVWVAQIRTNLVPQASVIEQPVQGTAVFLKPLGEISTINLFDLAIELRSDIDPVRLATIHLAYDPMALEIVKINTQTATPSGGVIYATASAQPSDTTPKVTQWLESLFDNKNGKLAVTGLFSEGNLKTESGKNPVTFVTLTVKAKKLPTEITIENSSLLLRAADNANILTKKESLILEHVAATPSAAAKEQ